MIIENGPLDSRLPRANFRTVNGKLIVQEVSEIKGMNSQVAELADQLKQLESTILAIQHQDRTECIKHFKSLKISVHNLRNLYHRLFWATTAALATLIIWLMWINWKSQPQTISCPIQAMPASLTHSN